MVDAVEYPIYAENGGLFCICRNDGTKVELEGKGGKVIDLMTLQRAAMNPRAALKSRGQKPKKQKEPKE